MLWCVRGREKFALPVVMLSHGHVFIAFVREDSYLLPLCSRGILYESDRAKIQRVSLKIGSLVLSPSMKVGKLLFLMVHMSLVILR